MRYYEVDMSHCEGIMTQSQICFNFVPHLVYTGEEGNCSRVGGFLNGILQKNVLIALFLEQGYFAKCVTKCK